MKKLLTALLVLAMAFTMVFATAASAEDGYKDSITWVIGNDQDILDPQNNVSNSKVIPQYYDGLLGYDNDGNVVCKMAESYEASEDKMTWTFHLRQDVYFHSGRHCTAHDFEATFDRLLNTENPQRYTSIASFIDTAVATDDYTFVITLKEPKAFFLQAIAKHWAFVLNPEYIEKYGADLGKTAESVDGTGPFKCTQWDKGEVMKFEAFENYYEGAPLTHEIVMKILIAIPCGMLAAKKRGTIADYFVSVLSMLGISLPSFLMGLGMVLLFAVNLRVLPAAGYKNPFTDGFLPFLRYMTLPAVSLGFIHAGYMMRMTKASMLEVLGSDYIKMARSKGVREWKIVTKHTFRNALLTVITVVGQGFISALAGAAVVERLFNIPGMGSLMVDSIEKRDYQVIQAITLLIAMLNVFINLIIDLIYGLADPRIRLD